MLLFKTFSGYPPPGNGDPSPCRVLLELASSCFCGFQRPPLSLAPSHSSPSPYILCSACLTSGLTPQDSRVLGLGAPSQPSSRPELHVFLGAPRARPSSCPESPSCRPPPFPARSFPRPACVAPQPPARGRGLCGCCGTPPQAAGSRLDGAGGRAVSLPGARFPVPPHFEDANMAHYNGKQVP